MLNWDSNSINVETRRRHRVSGKNKEDGSYASNELASQIIKSTNSKVRESDRFKKEIRGQKCPWKKGSRWAFKEKHGVQRDIESGDVEVMTDEEFSKIIQKSLVDRKKELYLAYVDIKKLCIRVFDRGVGRVIYSFVGKNSDKGKERYAREVRGLSKRYSYCSIVEVDDINRCR